MKKYIITLFCSFSFTFNSQANQFEKFKTFLQKKSGIVKSKKIFLFQKKKSNNLKNEIKSFKDNYNEKYPFHAAVKENNLNQISSLFKNQKDIIWFDDAHKTPLDYAKEQPDLMRFLLNKILEFQLSSGKDFDFFSKNKECLALSIPQQDEEEGNHFSNSMLYKFRNRTIE